MQVQQRQHLGDLRGLPCPLRQDRRGEPPTLTRAGVDTLIVDPRRGQHQVNGLFLCLLWILIACR
jgi:hypothetical protein